MTIPGYPENRACYSIFRSTVRRFVQGSHRVWVIIVRTANDAITIRVCDNGSGVDVALREKIFEPFVSFKFGGNGIRLLLARQIIRGHGGRLILWSTDKQSHRNTIFEVQL
ncbi:sensor protein fixl [Gluconobacter frateurii NBRC 103465]|nr:sensor protein fixl [Gluconobacter frateurii NBRC 103465]